MKLNVFNYLTVFAVALCLSSFTTNCQAQSSTVQEKPAAKSETETASATQEETGSQTANEQAAEGSAAKQDSTTEGSATKEESAEGSETKDTEEAAPEPIAINIDSGRVLMSATGTWKKVTPRSRIVQYEIKVPMQGDDERDGRLTIMGAGGSVKPISLVGKASLKNSKNQKPKKKPSLAKKFT